MTRHRFLWAVRRVDVAHTCLVNLDVVDEFEAVLVKLRIPSCRLAGFGATDAARNHAVLQFDEVDLDDARDVFFDLCLARRQLHYWYRHYQKSPSKFQRSLLPITNPRRLLSRYAALRNSTAPLWGFRWVMISVESPVSAWTLIERLRNADIDVWEHWIAYTEVRSAWPTRGEPRRYDLFVDRPHVARAHRVLGGGR